MTEYYLHSLFDGTYKNAVEKFKQLRGKLLTQKNLKELFDFDGHNFAYDEQHDAFLRLIAEGWLIENAPGKFRVATLTIEEAKNKMGPERVQIKNLIEETARAIRQILQPKIDALKDKFPLIEFGIRDDKPREQNKQIREQIITVKVVKKTMPAVIISTDNKFWEQSWVTILTPEELFSCPYILAKSVGSIESEPCPDWLGRQTNPILWLRFADKIAIELSRL